MSLTKFMYLFFCQFFLNIYLLNLNSNQSAKMQLRLKKNKWDILLL